MKEGFQQTTRWLRLRDHERHTVGGQLQLPLHALQVDMAPCHVAVVVERRELVIRIASRVLATDHFEAAQAAVAVLVECRERRVAAIPLAALDQPVVIQVEVVEVGIAGIVFFAAEELGAADGAIAILIDASRGGERR